MELASPLLLTAPAGAGILALAVLTYALRGRSVDDHPHCRRCGFDLFGLPPDRTVCPECGGDLTARRAVRRGRRVVRKGLLALSSLLLLPSLALLCGVTWARARGFDLNPHKPAWLLTREAFAADSGTRDRAMDELLKRRQARALGPRQIDEILERVLSAQADGWRPWWPRWGEFVEDARAAGDVDHAQWVRYARQGIESGLKLKAAPSAARGQSLPLQVWWQAPRLGPRKTFRVEYFWRASVDKPADPHGPFVAHMPLHGYAPPPKAHALAGEQTGKLADGWHEVYVAVQVLEWPSHSAYVLGNVQTRPLVLIERLDLTAKFMVHPGKGEVTPQTAAGTIAPAPGDASDPAPSAPGDGSATISRPWPAPGNTRGRGGR